MNNSPAETLASLYRVIQQDRMRDVPLLNSNLEVQTVGFRPFNKGWIGILITPWCMNLLLMPGLEDWSHLQPGQEMAHELGGGVYRFIVAEEAALGRFQSCSLFSPMFEFPDQPTAVAVAEEILASLLRQPESPPEPGYTRRQWLQGLRRPDSI